VVDESVKAVKKPAILRTLAGKRIGIKPGLSDRRKVLAECALIIFCGSRYQSRGLVFSPIVDLDHFRKVNDTYRPRKLVDFGCWRQVGAMDGGSVIRPQRI